MIKRIVNPYNQVVVSEIDVAELHRYIVNKIAIEFSNMSENCYFPKIAEIYRDILHMTHSNEKDLIEYSKLKYQGKETYKLLHDPFTTLLILVVQEFLHKKDLAAAESAFHLFTLRFHANLMHRYLTPKTSRKSICIPSAFQGALEQLSKNHMFSKMRTIPNSILYYSRMVFRQHKQNLEMDDADGLASMIYSLRTRLNQSMRSFANKYYDIIEKGKHSTEQTDGQGQDSSHETKMRMFINKIVNDLCVYGKVDQEAIINASAIIKFNKKLSIEYANKLSDPSYAPAVENSLYLLLKDIKDTSIIHSNEFLEYVQKLMSIKITKQPTYFKKFISEIHVSIIRSLGLEVWYDNLSIQSQSISRNFIAYYIAFYARKYF